MPSPDHQGYELPETRACECGCGARVRRRFVSGHNARIAGWREEDCGHDTPCWVWTGTRTVENYPRLRVAGRARYAHVHLYEQHVGPVPSGLQLDHLCRVTLCVNPDHLEPVTPAENSRRSSVTKLSLEDRAAIRVSEESNAALAARYGVIRSHISKIRHGHLSAAELEAGVQLTAVPRNRAHKLTPDQREAIRASSLPTAELAEQYGINKSHVWRIRSGRPGKALEGGGRG